MENKFDYAEYRDSFEDKVIKASLNHNDHGSVFKKRKVPAKKGKLYNTEFVGFVGDMFNCEDPIAIDYYGFFKKSSGFIEKMDSFEDIEVKSMLVPVAHFASIRIEIISDLAPELIINFSDYKKYLLSLRGFKG